MSLWSIIVPESGTNLVTNPSAESATGSAATYNGATVTRDTTQARFGDYCYLIAPSAGSQGASLATSGSAASSTHYVSGYVYGTITGSLQVSMNGSTGTWNTLAAIGGATGGWVRYGASVAASLANNSVATLWRNTANENWRLDGLQVEAASYATTYIDGDQGPLYRWTGLRHGSSSTRDAQDRLGGRERDLSDYGAYVTEEVSGVGVPGVINNLVGQALQPGAAFQSTKIMPRSATLKTALTVAAPDDIASLHALRQDLIDLVKPNRVRGNQPFVLGYSGAKTGTKVYSAFRYDGGLEFGPLTGVSELGVGLRLTAVDPFWYTDDRETSSLTLYASLTSAYAARRTNGQWAALGSGLNGTVYAIAYDRVRGRIYFGFDGTTANGVTVNRITYWNGSTFVAMDGGVNGTVSTVAVAANGDVWVGGSFTTVGSGAAATKGLARWNISTGTWTAFNESTGSFAGIKAIAIKNTGQVVIAGDFTNWETDAASDYICKTDDNGVNWDAMGTSPFSATLYPARHQSLAFDASGNLWAGSYLNTGTSTASLYKWNGSAWTTVLTTNSDSLMAIYALYFAPDGLLYIGGRFASLGGVTAASVAVYNGTTVAPLGAGVSIEVYSLGQTQDGVIYFGGSILSAGLVTGLVGLAAWNGSVWIFPDISFSPSANVTTLAAVGNDLYTGHDSTGGSTTSSALTTVSPTATASIYPTFTAIGPTSAYAVLQSIENLSTGHRLYFNVQVYAGETLTITLTPGQRQVVSDWRGVISSLPLSNSDWAAWHLLGAPATNSIAAFMGFTTTGAALLAHWQPRHLSIDGPA